MCRMHLLWATSIACIAGFAAQGAEPDFEKQIKPMLAQHCAACHGPEKTKGDLRLDQLKPDFADSGSRQKWQEVLKRIQAGEMPPKAQPQPAAKDVALLTEWIRSNVLAAEKAKRAEGRVAMRRLNRTEYENTVRDLLGVDVDFNDLLPMDSSAAGFDNVAEAQHVSTFLMERYLEAAERALNVAIANAPQPPVIKKRYHVTDERHVKVTTEKVFRKEEGTLIAFSSSAWQAVMLGQFYPPDRGKYKFRISAYGIQSDDKPVTYRLTAGTMGMSGRTRVVGYIEAPPGKASVYEFVEHLEARSTIRLLPHGLAAAQTVNKIGADNYIGPGLAVEWIDVEGPLHDVWPPESHRRIFGDLPQIAAKTFKQYNRVETTSKNPEADAERIVRDFAGRAFRRNIVDADVKPILDLVNKRLAEKHTFEQAVRVGLMAVMVSPNFLFLRETPGKLDNFALANRLSYFLWSSMPDAELLAVARKETLGDPAVLRAQVDRMLKDKRASAFTENFVSQWLGLRDIDATMPSHIFYPEFDEMLRASLLKEPYLFFEELLKHDLSIANVISSDFTLINNRLAKHYGIPGVEGWEFRKVKLPADSHRGGVLTMAAVLKATANGTYTSPILRGAWVLERILGTPPPRPPEGIAAVEPDIRGAVTIREQLAKHRQLASCATCHVKIDPPGFALESFDVIGGYREFYRVTGNGKIVTIEGRKMPYYHGKKIDPADELADGRKFANIDEYKELLLKDKDLVARNLATRLLTYATGAEPTASDAPAVEAILTKLRAKDYGLRTLVHEIVQSELFRTK